MRTRLQKMRKREMRNGSWEKQLRHPKDTRESETIF